MNNENNFILFLENFINTQSYPNYEIEKCVYENLPKYYDEDIFIKKENNE